MNATIKFYWYNVTKIMYLSRTFSDAAQNNGMLKML